MNDIQLLCLVLSALSAWSRSVPEDNSTPPIAYSKRDFEGAAAQSDDEESPMEPRSDNTYVIKLGKLLDKLDAFRRELDVIENLVKAKRDADEEDSTESVMSKILTANKIDKDKKVGGVSVFEGDMVNTAKLREQIALQKLIAEGVKIQLDASLTGKWTNGQIPYTFHASTSVNEGSGKEARTAVEAAIKEMNAIIPCVKWVPRTNQKDYAEFTHNSEGCWSYVGMTGGRQEISIGQGCEDKGVALHEMMHAIGFHHEQSRIDRDLYVVVNFTNIPQDWWSQFDKYQEGEATTYNAPYDFKSIMHYDNFAVAIDSKYMTVYAKSDPTIRFDNKNSLSDIDIQQVKTHYGCPGPCASVKCADKATCRETGTSYVCECIPGYTGDGVTCSQGGSNPCASNPCHKNADCKVSGASFSCSCKAGFTGDGVTTCTVKDPCSSKPCHKDATCTPSSSMTTFTCTCNSGLTGDGVKNCKRMKPCASNPCHKDAVCKESKNSFTCTCKAGYSGDGVKTCDALCADKLDNCNALKNCCSSDSTECSDEDISLAQASCANTCSLCLCTKDDPEVAEYCGQWKKKKYCMKKYKAYMQEHCPATCGFYLCNAEGSYGALSDSAEIA